MASVCIFMLVAIFVGQVFARTSRDCSNVELIRNCDECFRCGGTWCMNPDTVPRCSIRYEDSWCSDWIRSESSVLDLQNQFIGIEKETMIELREEYEQPEITLVNSTVKDLTVIEKGVFDVKLYSDRMNRLYVNVYKDFCPTNGQVAEYVTVKVRDVKWGDTKTEVVKLGVCCACNCSSQAVQKSENCSGRGTYSCNVCACEDGWEGDRCEIKTGSNLDGCGYDEQHTLSDGTPISNDGRGDIDSCYNNDGVRCSNKGKCVEGRCICDQTLEGSQYFDSTCTDICQSTNYHDSCLLNPPLHGICKEHDMIIMVDSFNSTIMAERDRCNRKIWVSCTVQSDECTIKYMAMRDPSAQTHVMILEPCNAIISSPRSGPLKVTVPVILGVLAVVAAAAAVAGYMVWKNRAPPLPLNNPGYSNIDAEDCTGMNPLYKPPTSSFKNPTYGKW